MEKLKYMAISHLTEQQAINMLKNINTQSPETYKRKSSSPHKINVNVPYFKQSPIKQNNLSHEDSIIDPFLEVDNEESLKQDYSRLWYEKLALEMSVQRLIGQNAKKDQVIRNLKSQLTFQLRNSLNPH